MKVSVSITTYNHEAYIGEAIESVLAQKTAFDFEIVIGEDDSKDNTRNMVKAYKSRFPDKIRAFFNDRKNVIFINNRPTGRWNLINNLKNVRGEYVSLLDGDDYWSDPYKLQKQVDFLAQKNEMAGCFHAMDRVFEGGSCQSDIIGNHPAGSIYSFHDMFALGGIVPSSVMFRRSAVRELPGWFERCPSGDKALFCIIASYGKFGYLNETMGVYRFHEGGVWSGQSDRSRIISAVGTKEMICRHLMPDKKKELQILKNAYAKECLRQARHLIFGSRISEGFSYAVLAFRLVSGVPLAKP